MLARTKPLEQLTPGEYAEYFANELTVRHNRPPKFAMSIAVTYARMYQDRGLEPENAAGVWVQEFGTKMPPAPAPREAPKRHDAGMGKQNRSGEIDVVEKALQRPVTKKKK